jgi:hypothetical protein
MSAEKYLYFRKATAVADDHDDTTGSNIYPVSALRGICSGTSNGRGVITDDEDAFSLFFTPRASTGSGGDADDAAGDNCDVIVVAITTDNNQKAVMKALVEEIRFGKQSIITVFDGVDGEKLDADIEDLTIISVVNAD